VFDLSFLYLVEGLSNIQYELMRPLEVVLLGGQAATGPGAARGAQLHHRREFLADLPWASASCLFAVLPIAIALSYSRHVLGERPAHGG
jgi:hypothetical protein